MTTDREKAIVYARTNASIFENNLKELVKIPSVSTDPEKISDMMKAAQNIVQLIKNSEFEYAEVMSTKGHPVVFGRKEPLKEGEKTLLIYGHYDVQPPDPIELWNTPPFQPTVQGDRMFGRGASDMKGQIIASLSAVESVLKQGEIPLNIKVIIEGEEEIGSPNLADFLNNKKELLKCDFVLNPDSGFISSDLPAITYGLRGLAYFELRFFGPDFDLHSGGFGGAVHNPAQALCEIISQMHDKNGRVTLPGFYDRVLELSDFEKNEISRLPVSEDFYKKTTGVAELWGEKGYSVNERIGSRPTLEINGLLSGFTSIGTKTVLPAKAMAKISMRLVPNQDPNEVYSQLIEFLKLNVPSTIRWEVEQMAGGFPCLTDPNLTETKAMAQALEKVWGIAPVYKREGGSIPIVADMQKILGADSILTGFGLPEDAIHSPNESLHLPTFHKGIEALIHFIFNLIGK